MCSVDTCTDFDQPQKKNLTWKDTTCRKCPLKASVVLQTKFPYCRECFLEHFKHKVRATLGKSKLMKHSDKILIAFSGSASSLSLIDLMRISVDDKKNYTKSFEVNLLYIDESSAYNENNHINLDEIRDAVSGYRFKLFCTDLGAFFADEINTDIVNMYHHVNELDSIKNLFSNIQCTTSRMDFLLKIRENILFRVAQKLGCQKIFTAETSDDLAVNTIANIVQGRGGQLSQDIGFCNDRFSNVILLRPMQDCFKKEVTYYNIFNNLKPVTSISFGTKRDKYESIHKLTENFVNELQNSFPSTVSTIRSSGSKLSACNNEGRHSTCCFCQGIIDNQRITVTADQASRISSLVSSLGPDSFDESNFSLHKNADDKCCNDGNCPCSQVADVVLLKTMLDESSCYGCKLIFKGFKSLESLPNHFLQKLKVNAQFNKMHEEIKTFLL